LTDRSVANWLRRLRYRSYFEKLNRVAVGKIQVNPLATRRQRQFHFLPKHPYDNEAAGVFPVSTVSS
jgi:hypothetical protein